MGREWAERGARYESRGDEEEVEMEEVYKLIDLTSPVFHFNPNAFLAAVSGSP